MTKEKLEKEAEKSLDKRLGTYAYIRKQDCYTNYVDGYIDSAEPREKRIAELEKENAELKSENQKWKDEWQEQVQKATDEGYARTLQTIQLTKAKDIIKNLMVYVPVDLKEYEEAKQFLSEVEK